MDWVTLLASESADLVSLRKAATDWKTCPVGVYFPAFVDYKYGAWDVVGGCPPKLIRFGIQFMDAVNNGDREGALRVCQKIIDYKA